MSALDRTELEASPLADLHAIAGQIGLEGFRRLRKAELVDAILGEPPTERPAAAEEDDEEPRRPRRRRPRRAAGDEPSDEASPDDDEEEEKEEPRGGRGRGRGRGSRAGRAENGDEQRVAEGVVEVLGNGSAFLRVDPPEASDEDVYISAAQVRRCELVSGDRVSGPVRTPRRSERYSSLVRIEEINGQSADSVSDGSRYEDLLVTWPSERFSLGSGDPTLEAIEWLAPIGLGSRAVIVGPRAAGKTDTLRALAGALREREGIELSIVLVGARPEEIAEWGEGSVAPAAALSFAASSDAQGQALERVVESAQRLAARGTDAVVLVDSLDGVSAPAARKALASARNLRDGGSLTVIATASEPLGGETTVIALDPALASTGRRPILDLPASGTLRAELLVGDDGAKAITEARAAAIEAAG
ncbi:MAG TPA: Rho termination factor N-terminal domain-containing protein [Solirubrobacteraceae bacterium]|jgi:transcription termination factor Rho|nr:Rho termination factor N-terminal domain-containing protein [Solirubrobacteraceae bacterium]